MKIAVKIFFLSFILIGMSCDKNKPVTACIDLDQTTINAGDTITFTSCSENEWSYIWEISGPDSALENGLMWNDKVFKRAINAPGSYKVKLTTFSDFSFLGNSAADSTSFNVN